MMYKPRPTHKSLTKRVPRADWVWCKGQKTLTYAGLDLLKRDPVAFEQRNHIVADHRSEFP